MIDADRYAFSELFHLQAPSRLSRHGISFYSFTRIFLYHFFDIDVLTLSPEATPSLILRLLFSLALPWARHLLCASI